MACKTLSDKMLSEAKCEWFAYGPADATEICMLSWCTCCDVLSDNLGQKSADNKRTEYRDDDEEFTLERTCTKTTEKITANRKSRTSRRETRDDADQRVSKVVDELRVMEVWCRPGL